MSDAFKQIIDTEDYLGETYKYHKNVKNPKSLGVSGKGKFSALKNDVKAITEYVKVLVSGKSKASKTGKPLGNKFFIKTPGMCTDVVSGEEVPRSMYVNNIPEGNIPLLSGLTGSNFKDLRGLLPGMASNLNALNPMTMFTAFSEGRAPPCQKVTLPVVDTNNKKSKESAYVSLSDLEMLKKTGEIGRKIETMKPDDFDDEERISQRDLSEMSKKERKAIRKQDKKERKQQKKDEKREKKAEKREAQKEKVKKIMKKQKNTLMPGNKIKDMKKKLKKKRENKKNKKRKNIEGFGDFCELLHENIYSDASTEESYANIDDPEREDWFMQAFYLLMISYVLYMVYKTHY